MQLKAYAKVNLFLNVLNKSFNGFHSLETVMIPISLYDSLTIEMIECSNEIIIETNSQEIPTDKNNSLYKCIVLFREQFHIHAGFKIYLKKHIPISSGLGGESTDVATLMYYLNTSLKLNLSCSDIFYFGRLLGWDVPICYFRTPIYIDDLRSVCEFINVPLQYYILLIKPEFGILTKDAFEYLDRCAPIIKDATPLINELVHGNHNIGGLLHNTFIVTDKRLLNMYHELEDYCRKFKFDGISMSGTGSCFFMVTSDYEVALNGYFCLKNKFPYVYLSKTLSKRK